MRNWITAAAWMTVGFLFFSISAFSQLNTDSTATFFYIKKESNAGVVLFFDKEREEFRTDRTRDFEELRKGSAAFRWENQTWILLPYRQENWNVRFVAGPYFGKGDWMDSSEVQVIDAKQKLAGIGSNLQANYSGRFYFDQKNYTLVSVTAWGSYNLFRRNAEGSLTDSNQVAFVYDKTSEHSKLRYGFRAKAGWGSGRLDPVNHYMAAASLLEKYYPGKLFSEEEITKVAFEIGRIKSQREARTGHLAEKEWEQVAEFLNRQLLLKVPENAAHGWGLTEFRPRFNGARIEFGPFFNYFSREPDMVYGGYLKYENHNYCSLKRNRNLSVSLSYNGYKNHDWILLEADLGWNFYPNLKNEYSLGFKYIPGAVVDGLDDMGPVRHNFIPYLEYFSQISSKYRIKTAMVWHIAPNDQFMLPGPEVSVSVYRSRY